MASALYPHTPVKFDSDARAAFFAALENNAFETKFLDALQERKASALAVLKTSDVTFEERVAAREMFLSSESMLLSHHEGRTPEEKTEWLKRFIEDALLHAEGKPQRKVSGHKTILRANFESRAIRPEDLRNRAKAALNSLEVALGETPDTTKPSSSYTVSRRDLLRKAVDGVMPGIIIGGIAGKLADQLVTPVNMPALGMSLGATAGALFKYFDSTGAVIQEKQFAEELGNIFSATAEYCSVNARENPNAVEAVSLTDFFRELKTNTNFRVAFLAGLKQQRHQVEQLILNGDVPTDADIKLFLACDSILNAYTHARREKPMFKEVPDPTKGKDKFKYVEIPTAPETLGDEINNQGNITWLVTYLESAIHPDKPIERVPLRLTPNFADPDIRKEDFNMPVRTALDHLSLIARQQDNPAACAVIKRVLPEYQPTRREVLRHFAKGAAVGAASGAGLALTVDAEYPSIPDVSDSSGHDKTVKAVGGAIVGALAGTLYQHVQKTAFTDRKQLQAEIDYVIHCAATHCLAHSQGTAAAPSR